MLSLRLMQQCHHVRLLSSKLVLSNISFNPQIINNTFTRAPVFQLAKKYATDVKKEQLHVKSVKIQDVLQKNKQLLQDRKNILVQDIRERKDRVKERVDQVIERENIFTVPNLLCIGRCALAPYLSYVIIQNDFSFAMGLLVAAAISDWADGYIARTFKGQASNFGSFLDPLADKLLMGSLVITLSYCDLLPIWLTCMVLFRDVFLIGAGFVIRFQSLPAPRTLTRYFDATHATAQLAPTFISKVNTAIQLFTIAATLGAPIWDYIDHPYLHGLWYLTGVTTVAAAMSYITMKDTYKFLSKHKKAS